MTWDLWIADTRLGRCHPRPWSLLPTNMMVGRTTSDSSHHLHGFTFTVTKGPIASIAESEQYCPDRRGEREGTRTQRR